jgi:hypothetical protein
LRLMTCLARRAYALGLPDAGGADRWDGLGVTGEVLW